MVVGYRTTSRSDVGKNENVGDGIHEFVQDIPPRCCCKENRTLIESLIS